MKKIIALFAALLMVLSLSACKKASEDIIISDTSAPADTSSTVSQENATQTESEKDKQDETKAETPVDDISSTGDNVINAGDFLGSENAESSKKPSSSSSSKKPSSSSSSSSKKPSSSSSKVDPPDDAAQDMEVESKKEQFTPYV